MAWRRNHVAVRRRSVVRAQAVIAQEQAGGQELSEAEREVARQAVVEASRELRLLVRRPLAIGRIELLREKGPGGEESPERLALVTVYRYEGNLGIRHRKSGAAGRRGGG